MKAILPAFTVLLLLAGCNLNENRATPSNSTSNRAEAPADTPSLKTVEPAVLGDTPRVSRAGDLWFAGQPSEGDWQAVTDAGIKRVIDLRDRAEDRGYDESVKLEGLGLGYQVFEVRKEGFSPEVVEPAVKALSEAEKSGEGTLVHCASSNRVGSLVAIWRYRQGEDIEKALEAGKAAGAKSDATARKYIEQHPNP
ncbi:MAG: hypothetical protein KDB82_14720 [Planctomycetes bacterium]|nr:hypothetical protein [Planctomycetota bacterium]